MRGGKPIHRPELTNDDAYSIIDLYQSEYRGYVQFYSLAQNIGWLGKVHWAMRLSLLKTLAWKYKTSVANIRAKYQKTVKLPQGLRKCVEITVGREGKQPLVASFGGIPLKRNSHAVIHDLPLMRYTPSRNELIKRLLANVCEVCGATDDIQIHHVRALKDLKVKGRKEKPLWMQLMSARRRKTLVVCRDCHSAIHQGNPLIYRLSKQDTGEP